MSESATKNAFDSVSGLYDKVSQNVGVLDEVGDDEKIFKNELVIEVTRTRNNFLIPLIIPPGKKVKN